MFLSGARADLHFSDHDCAMLDNQVFGVDIAKEPRGGFQGDRVLGAKIRRQFTDDFRRADRDRVRPAEMIIRRNDQMSGGQAAFDVGGGVNGEGTQGRQFAVEFSLMTASPTMLSVLKT